MKVAITLRRDGPSVNVVALHTLPNTRTEPVDPWERILGFAQLALGRQARSFEGSSRRSVMATVGSAAPGYNQTLVSPIPLAGTEMMVRTEFLAIFVFTGALLSAISDSEAASHGNSPNVVMICIDDLNDWVGCLGGHPQADTPHIDALAKRGRLFSNAHCSVPVCSPSRICIMSGLHATTHGSYELGPGYTTIARLDDVPTMQGYFKRHGYTTLSGGKVLHGDFVGRLAADIDETLGQRRGGPKPKRPIHWTPQVWDWGAYPETDDEMYDYQLATAAADRLRKGIEGPFFLSVGFYRPHVPMYVPPKWFSTLDIKDIRLPEVPADDVDDLPPNFRHMIQIGPTHEQIVSSGQWRGFVQAYLASTRFVDHCVGTVIAGLDEGPERDDTLVVLWSDHGFHLGEKEHWAKRTLWEESTRVPLIIAGAGITGGQPCGEAVSLLDVYPTLVQRCGLPQNPDLEGVSLAPQLDDPATARDRPVITSSYEGNHAIRSRDWRYIRYADGAEELYDHRSDPNEYRNLAGDQRFGETKQRLAAFVPKVAASEVKPPKTREYGNQQLLEKQRANGPVK